MIDHQIAIAGIPLPTQQVFQQRLTDLLLLYQDGNDSNQRLHFFLKDMFEWSSGAQLCRSEYFGERTNMKSLCRTFQATTYEPNWEKRSNVCSVFDIVRERLVFKDYGELAAGLSQ